MTGLAYLGIGIGNFLGIGFVAKTSDATIIKLAKRNKGVYEPEMRLPLCVFFGFLIPASFFWYGKCKHDIHIRFDTRANIYRCRLDRLLQSPLDRQVSFSSDMEANALTSPQSPSSRSSPSASASWASSRPSRRT